jgi:hypothetical protein
MNFKESCDAVVIACGVATFAIGLASVVVYVRFLCEQ